MTWWHYLFLTNLYLVLFYGFYALLLQRETFFQLNRIYLVGSAVVSFGIPLMQLGWVQQWLVTQQVQTIYKTAPAVIYQFSPISQAGLTLGEIAGGVYLLGIGLLVIRLIWQLTALRRYMKGSRAAAAWSFFKQIQVDQQLNQHQVIAAHEQVHASQWHSADVLLMELITIVNWFNPVVYLYRHAVKQIHEYIADRDALKTGTSKADYALLLLSQTFQAPVHHLLNPFFNRSVLRQRIMMLHKNKSHGIALLKYGFSAPLFMLMLVLSAATVNSSRAVKAIHQTAEQVFEKPATVAAISEAGQIIAATTQNELPLPGAGTATERVTAPTAEAATRVTEPEPVITPTDSLQPVRREVFTAVEHSPEFKGGMMAFYQFLGKNLRYPVKAIEDKKQGKAIITFIVEPDGTLSDIQTLRNPGSGLGEEAARIVAQSPKWVPGLQNGRPVRVQYTVPVLFTLPQSTGGDKADTSHLPRVTKLYIYKSSTGTDNATHPETRIITSGGGAQPLLFVDGKEEQMAAMKNIDPQIIESIQVLKDKAATDVYGSRAANGVVRVMLKKTTAAQAGQ